MTAQVRPSTGGTGAVLSVNARTGAVTGLAEGADLATEIADRGAADTAHAAAGDPHPGYLTPAEGNAAYDTLGAAAAAQAAAIAASQPVDGDLTAIAALTTTTYGRAFLALADAAAGRSALALGTAATSNTGDFDAAGAATAAQAASQPLDSDLTAIAALSTTSFGRSLLALADAAAGRTALGLGTAATSAASDFEAVAGHTSNSIPAASGSTSLADIAMGASTILARLAAGNIVAATPAQLKTLLAIAESDVTGLVADLAAKAAVLTRTAVKTSNYTAVLWELVPCDTSAGAFTLTLPAASGGKGRIAIKLVVAGNTLNLALTGADKFNTSSGATTGSLTLANQGIICESDGSSIWTITADDIPLSQLDLRFAPVASPTFTGTVTLPEGNDAAAAVASRRTLGTGATQAAAGTDARFSGYGLTGTKSGQFYVPQVNTTAAFAAAAQAIGVLYVIPILLRAGTLDRIAVNHNNTLLGGETARLGIYNDVGGYPGTVLLDAGTVDLSTAAALKAITISQAVTQGIYWLACVRQGATATPQLVTYLGANSASALAVGIPAPGDLFSTARLFLTQASVTGALATFTSTVTISGAGPLIAVRYV